MIQKIHQVIPGSIADELGIVPGDELVAMNREDVEDVLDYEYQLHNEELTLTIREGKTGEEYEAEIEKEEYEDLGLVFEEQFMSSYRHCQNHCVFCFIDQMPKGMRPTLYFKDDDARLSFLNGNYITMTNMKEHDFERVVKYHLSPMNVSIHTTNPELRVAMLKNPKAAEVLPRLKQFIDANITVNGQIVLCKGINDGPELDRTLQDLFELVPGIQSLSIVPVGLTKYRENLTKLEPFTKEDAEAVIAQVNAWRKRYFEAYGIYFVHLSDEFYLKANLDFPSAEEYDDYPQIENGVGMMRLFMDEAEETLKQVEKTPSDGEITVVTAKAAGEKIREITEQIMALRPGATIHTRIITNHFFGENITVTGLLTGQDILEQLKGKPLGTALLLSNNLLKADEDVLLDDVSVDEIKNTLQMKVIIIKSSGKDFVESCLRALQ